MLCCHDGILYCTYYVDNANVRLKYIIDFATKSAEPGTGYLQKVLKEIYVAYTDCALKDPFYELEMPIRCELFTQAVNDVMSRFGNR